MHYTISEKILLQHSGKNSIRQGEFVFARVDFTLANDITGPLAIREFAKANFRRVFDRKRIALIPDHFAPAKDILSANNIKMLRDFAETQQLIHYYEVGRMGIEHALLPELGLVTAGQLIIGADSHTCTYGALGAFSTGVGSTDLAATWATGRCWFRVPASIKLIYRGRFPPWVGGKDLILYTIKELGVEGAHYRVMEFSGEAIRHTSMDERLTICNMTIEAGGKSGIIEPDETTLTYLKAHPGPWPLPKKEGLFSLRSDPGADYDQVKEFDVSRWEPAVACPPLPSNVVPARTLKAVRLNQVVIGSCTNGRFSDLRIAARILKGSKVHRRVRLIIFPATQRIYREAAREGLLETFIEAGGIVSTPTCGPCLGGHAGVLGKAEVCLATTNRNFTGRMGEVTSKVYLSGPAVAAASAIAGRIVAP